MKYTGTLNKPIVSKPIGLLSFDESYQAELERIDGERAEKLPELFEAHGVEPGNWYRLSVALALEHVPGFKVIKPAGRPTEWEEFDKAEFRLDVDAFIINSGNTLPVTEAIQRARRLDAWKSKTEAMKPAALRKHYDMADMRMVKLIQDTRE